MFTRLDALKANNLDKKNRTTASAVALKSSPDGTQHSEWHHITVTMVYLAMYTTLAMSV